MKKKKLDAKLTLRKKVISKLDSTSLHGGTNTIVVTVTIDITIEISRQHPDCPITKFCETEPNQYCISKPDPDCPSGQVC